MHLGYYLHIHILWILLNIPDYIISAPTVKLKIDEESPIHTTLGNISSFLFPKSKITTNSAFFSINSNGLVQLAKRLDLESLCREDNLCCERDKLCELTSTIVIEGRNSLELEFVELSVLVNDINDHMPKFPTGQNQTVKISELAEIGTLINLIPATDDDLSIENQIQRYTIHGSELQQKFELDITDLPNVYLRLIQSLDYELTKTYYGILEVCDKKYCTQQNLTVLILDANDNKPIFTKHLYEISIPENFTIGDIILTLEATDKDSVPNAQMDFRIQSDTDPNLKKTFRLESNTGHLILHSRLAAHQRSEYRFSVTVGEILNNNNNNNNPNQFINSDLIQTSVSDTANVIITIEDLNDFSPTIRMLSPLEGQILSIPENLPNQRICVLQVTDNDLGNNGKFECRLIPTSLDSMIKTDSFTLTQTGNHYTLLTSQAFDAEIHSQVTVTIACTDFGLPVRASSRDLNIQIQDVNEYQPELEKLNYYTSINENVPAGQELLQIVAHDRDQTAKLHYELGTEGKQYFTIDSTTGIITTLGSENQDGNYVTSLLDREKTEKITFIVCVTDGIPTNPCGVQSNINNANGNSNSKLENNNNNQHSLKQDTNVIIFTASATVFVTVLDENDNYPQFINKGPFSVLENQPRFTQITGRLTAIDPDEGENGRIRYNLRHVWVSATSVPVSDIFQIDSEGRIRTMEILDRELTNAYTLELMACDSASINPLCTHLNITITILDENDNKPDWHYPHSRDKEVNITTDLPPGRVVARVLAIDSDAGENGQVVYSLIDPHRRTVFQIDNVTGEISVINSKSNDIQNILGKRDLDYVNDDDMTIHVSPLLPGVYRLRLRASDLGHPEQATETWLQVNVFGSEIITNAGLNFMIIVIMIAITGIISICLVVAIICVRRRSTLRWNRQNTHRDTNGFRRGRSAGDGAEGSMFPLKHEYNHILDGTGYMMGISPTPSDLDAIKLAYQTNTNSYLDNNHNHNAISDGHLYNWTNNIPQSNLYYTTQSNLNNPINHSICSLTIDSLCTNQNNTLHMPIYAPLNNLQSTFNPDTDTLIHCPNQNPNMIGTLSSSLSTTTTTTTTATITTTMNSLIPNTSLVCGTFNSCSPVIGHYSQQFVNNHDSNIVTSCIGSGVGGIGGCNSALHNFNDISNTTNISNNESNNNMKQLDLCNLISPGEISTDSYGTIHSAHLPTPRQCYTPLLIGTNNAALNCYYTTTNRRIQSGSVGPIHCELDVESADSGRGASEDDPVQMNGQLMHFYPNYQLMNLANLNSSLHSNQDTLVNGINLNQLENNEMNTDHSDELNNKSNECEWNKTGIVRRLKL